MVLLKGTKTVKASSGSLIYFDMVGTRKSGLQHDNCGETRDNPVNKNDIAIEKISNEYPEIVGILKNE